jgi:hypothetical protein
LQGLSRSQVTPELVNVHANAANLYSSTYVQRATCKAGRTVQRTVDFCFADGSAELQGLVFARVGLRPSCNLRVMYVLEAVQEEFGSWYEVPWVGVLRA